MQKVKSRKMNYQVWGKASNFLRLESLEISEDGAGKEGYEKP